MRRADAERPAAGVPDPAGGVTPVAAADGGGGPGGGAAVSGEGV